jgi:hypothetical protein
MIMQSQRCFRCSENVKDICDVSNLSLFQIDEMDMFAFCGTTTGDIVKIRLNYDSEVDILDPVTNPVLLGCLGKYVKRTKLQAGEEPARYSQGQFVFSLQQTHLIYLFCSI